MIFNQDMVSGQEMVTIDEESGLKRDKVVKIARLTGCMNFVGKREKYSMR